MTKLGPCSKKQEMILNNESDILVCGGSAGSGKSFLILLMVLKYIDCPYWRGVIFRRTTTEIRAGGGLADEALSMYNELPKEHRPVFNSSNLTFTFPTGAKLELSHLQHHPVDTMKQHGRQASFVGFDELQTFEEEQFIYLLSRLRSKSKHKSRIVGTCNPSYSSFLLNCLNRSAFIAFSAAPA